MSQKLSYDNWLKKVKGIEKGAHGIKGDEHTKLSKQWKDYRGKDKLAASYEQVVEACWTGYKQVGMKMKNGKEVPNCVPDPDNKIPKQKKR